MRSSATSGIGLMPTMSSNWYLGGSPTSITSHVRNDTSVSPTTVDQSGIRIFPFPLLFFPPAKTSISDMKIDFWNRFIKF